jgi:hypothetical protein
MGSFKIAHFPQKSKVYTDAPALAGTRMPNFHD